MRAFFVLGMMTLSASAHAFCGFFVSGNDSKLTNNASQVALLRKGNRPVMTMANTYQGPPENFAMVVPVPVVLQKQDVKTLAADVFDHIDSLSAPRLVEYWERDPCYVEPPYGRADEERAPGAALPKSAREGGGRDLGVKIEAQFVVGEYEIVILSAKDSSGLDKWLRQSHYTIPQGAGAALAPYVRDQMKFFVAKVDIHKVKRDANGTVQLSPLRFSFESNELRLPVRLGLLNASGKQDLIFREAQPVTGGRANYDGTSGDAGAQVVEGGGANNFQGRYIIRHYWTGEVKCDHPRYNLWGGPPGGGEPQASAAKGLATAPRGKVALKSVVRSPVPVLAIPGQPPPRRK